MTTWNEEFERAFDALCLPECFDVDNGLITTDRTADCLIGARPARPSQSSPIIRDYLDNARRLVTKLAYRRRLMRQAEETRRQRIERFQTQLVALFAGESDKLPNGGIALCGDLATHMPGLPGSAERIEELRRRAASGIEVSLFDATFEMHERFSG